MVHTRWMHRHCRHRMHARLSDILDYDGNIKIPCSNCLIIWSSDKPPIFIHKSNGINGAQMLVVFLSYFTGADIILSVVKNESCKDNRRGFTWMIFLSDIPAKKTFCLSLSGWNLTTYGILPLLNRLMHCPVSVSHNFICRSYPQDENRCPSFEKARSLMYLLWPMKVCKQLPCVYMSHNWVGQVY